MRPFAFTPLLWSCLAASLSFASLAQAGPEAPATRERRVQEERFVEVAAATKASRSALANLGVSLEIVQDASVWIVARPEQVAGIEAAGFHVLATRSLPRFLSELDFPSRDARFHNYERLAQTLETLAADHPDLVAVSSIGRSLEGRDILALHLTADANAL